MARIVGLFLAVAVIAAHVLAIDLGPVRGEIQSEAPLQVEGLVGIERHPFVLEGFPAKPTKTPLFLASSARIWIRETTATDGPPLPGRIPIGKGGVNGFSAFDRTNTSDFVAASVRVVLLSPLARANVLAADGEDAQRTVVVSGTSCETMLAPAVVPYDGYGTAASAAPENATWLKTRCEIPPVATVHGDTWIFFNETILLLQWRENGTAREQVVETGRVVRPHPTLPLLYEISSRVMGVRSQDGTGLLTLETPPRVELQSPVIAVSGRLTVPSSNGSLAAHEHVYAPAIPRLTLNGSFALMASEGTVAIEGFANRSAMPHDFARANAFVALGLAIGLGGLLGLRRRPRLFLWSLYSRLTHAATLENKNRRAILESIRENPGIHSAKIASLMGASRGRVRHHLGVLSARGFIRCRKHGGRSAWFVAETSPEPPQMSPGKDLRLATLRRILSREPSLSQRALARRMGVSQPYVHRLLRRLRNSGMDPPVSRR